MKKRNKFNKYQNETRADTATFFGVSTRTVDRWVLSGFPKKSNGRYNLPECVAWRIDQLTMDAAAGEPASPQLERFRKLRADLLAIDLKEREGKLVPIDNVYQAWGQRYLMFRDSLLSLQDRLPALLVGCPQLEIKKKLDDEARYILNCFTKDGKFTPRSATETEGPDALQE